jgi:hypothetical protein
MDRSIRQPQSGFHPFALREGSAQFGLARRGQSRRGRLPSGTPRVVSHHVSSSWFGTDLRRSAAAALRVVVIVNYVDNEPGDVERRVAEGRVTGATVMAIKRLSRAPNPCEALTRG